jgi:putative acetyltransferase
MNAFVIRRSAPDDSRELDTVFRLSVRDIASRDYTPSQIETWVSGPLDWHRRASRRIVWVAEDECGLIGFIQYEPPDHIDLLYVHPRLVRKGAASALLNVLEAEAQRRNVRVLHVEASITSRPFFAARGYELLTAQMVRVLGQDFLNYRMMKRLG